MWSVFKNPIACLQAIKMCYSILCVVGPFVIRVSLESIPFLHPLLLFETTFTGTFPVQSRGTWIARDSVNCSYLIACLWIQVEKLLEISVHRVAWLEPWMKTQRHCFQPSKPLYGNSTAFLACIPQALLCCEGFSSLVLHVWCPLSDWLF